MKELFCSTVCAFLLFATPSNAVEREHLTAATTDVPALVDLSYAVPATWFALPPIVDFEFKQPSPPFPSERDYPVLTIRLASVP